MDESEIARHRANAAKPSPLGGLFDAPTTNAAPVSTTLTEGWVTRWASLTEEDREAQRGRWREQLRPIVEAMALRRGVEGITASDVLSEGITAGILNAERPFLTANPRVYSWIGAFLRSLAATDGPLAPKTVNLPDGGTLHVTRRAEREASHANRNGVYIARRLAA